MWAYMHMEYNMHQYTESTSTAWGSSVLERIWCKCNIAEQLTLMFSFYMLVTYVPLAKRRKDAGVPATTKQPVVSCNPPYSPSFPRSSLSRIAPQLHHFLHRHGLVWGRCLAPAPSDSAWNSCSETPEHSQTSPHPTHLQHKYIIICQLLILVRLWKACCNILVIYYSNIYM